MSHESSRKAILYALGANFGIAIAKTGASLYTGSGSMLAESIHSYADCGNQLLLFLGLHRAKTPADREHPLGYGKAIYFWSFIVALMLFSMGGLFSIYEGIHKLSHPEPVHDAWVALAVLGTSIILEGLSLTGALKEVKKKRGSKGLLEWLKDSREAELVVVLGEDVAAISGLTLASGFILLAMITGNPIFDAVGSIVIGSILVIVALMVGVKIKGLLIGRSADPLLEEEIAAFMESNEFIVRVIHLITMQQGSSVVVAAKIEMKSELNIKDAVLAINAMEEGLKERFSQVEWTFIEPDIN
jgi:cation diffusion facilitator family transporter